MSRTIDAPALPSGNESFTNVNAEFAALRRATEKLRKRRERKAAKRKMLFAALLIGGAALVLQVKRWRRGEQ